MSPCTPLPPNAEAVLLFGSQALDFDGSAFRQLSTSVLNSPEHSWALRFVDTLSDTWKTICDELPNLRAAPGAAHLRRLGKSFRAGKLETTTLPNIILSPLVVIAQLTQYTTFANLRDEEALPPSGTVGFCIGLLSAFAVSSASSKGDFERYATVAARLALIIGALVDIDNLKEPSTTLAVAWKIQNNGTEELKQILKASPDVSNNLVPMKIAE